MTKIKLYKDITTEEIKTFAELKNEYEISINAELEIDNDTMIQIINENLWSCGGNIQILTSANDTILAWCNDYTERMEADRCMTLEEIEESTKENYFAILNNDSYCIESIIDNLYYNENEEDAEFYNRLQELIK